MLVQFFIPDLFLCLSNINLCDFCGGKENVFTFNIKIKLCSIKLELKFNLVRFLYILLFIFLTFFFFLLLNFLPPSVNSLLTKYYLKQNYSSNTFHQKKLLHKRIQFRENLFKTWSDVTAKALNSLLMVLSKFWLVSNSLQS